MSPCVYNWTPPHQTDFLFILRWLLMQRVRKTKSLLSARMFVMKNAVKPDVDGKLVRDLFGCIFTYAHRL